MIKIEDENVLCLKDAAKKLPRRGRGKRPSLATMYRWASKGLKGCKLETISIGGTLCTSLEALQRFFEKLSSTSASTKSVEVPDECDETEKELEASKW